jgi:hypothetical protein
LSESFEIDLERPTTHYCAYFLSFKEEKQSESNNVFIVTAIFATMNRLQKELSKPYT